MYFNIKAKIIIGIVFIILTATILKLKSDDTKNREKTKESPAFGM